MQNGVKISTDSGLLLPSGHVPNGPRNALIS
jgi:hypothetical protein